MVNNNTTNGNVPSNPAGSHASSSHASSHAAGHTGVQLHIHLVSDATGETLNSITRACLVQFERAHPIEHHWTLIRTNGQMDKVLAGIEAHPGLVLFTVVNDRLRRHLLEGCRGLGVKVVSVLDPIMGALTDHFGQSARGQSGRQHALDAEYFDRIAAMDFALTHDDGQSARSYEDADVILLGVSRSSKTPTCIYLANRGIKAANVPLVPGCPLPPELFQVKKPLIIGLTKDLNSLVQIRRNRLLMIAKDEESDYVDPQSVRDEIAQARRLCAEHGWDMIDVTRRSIEETAATIIQMLSEHRDRAVDGAAAAQLAANIATQAEP